MILCSPALSPIQRVREILVTKGRCKLWRGFLWAESVFVLKANVFDCSQAPKRLLEDLLDGRGEHQCNNSAAAFWLAGCISPTDVRAENRSSVGILCSPCSQGYNLFLIPPSVCTPWARHLPGRQPGFAGLSHKTYLLLRIVHLFAGGTASVLTAVGSAAIESAPSDPLVKTVLLD